MVGTYDYWLVLLSVVVAITASYVTLDLASRVAASPGRKSRWYWLVGGAISMGTGIWSMHFIGMLAFRLPIPVSYDIRVTLLSLLISILGSGFALVWVSFSALGMSRLLSGGLFMGSAIVFMHYTGMAAMRMDPPIQYQPFLFGLSIVIAVATSVAALWSAFRLRLETVFTAFWKKAGSALVMGSAIYGMHYTGMAAAVFAPNSVCTVNPQDINNVGLAGTLGGFTLLFLTATLLVSAFDAYLAERSSEHAKALREARDLLEARVAERTAELARTNQSLLEQIAERKRTHEALRQNEFDLEEAQRVARIGSWTFDFATNDVRWSDELYRIFDVEKSALGGKYEMFLSRVHPDDRNLVLQVNAAARSSGKPFEVEYRIKTQSGQLKHIRELGYGRKDGAGAVSGLFGTAQDITKRKEAEDRIRESEARLQAFMNNSPSAMLIKDLQGRYLHVNEQFTRSFGLDPRNVLLRTAAEIFPADLAAKLEATDARVLATGTPVETEEAVSLKHGVHTHLVCKFPIADAEGKIIALGGIRTDITERKRAEEQIRESREQLRALATRLNAVREQERASIALNIHDELGQALTSVKIDLSLLEQAVKSRKGRPSSAHTLRELRSAKRTIDNALDGVRRIASELRPAVLNELGLAAAIEWVAKDFEKRARIKCKVVLPDRIPEPDKERSTALYRILQEALTNVVRHAAAKTVEMELKEDGGKYVLRVRDDGVGIPDHRLNDWRSLGLNGMRERAIMFEGQVVIDRGPSGGTIVTASIPRDAKPPPAGIE